VEEHGGRDPQGRRHEVRQEPVGAHLVAARPQVRQAVQGALVRVARPLHQEGKALTALPLRGSYSSVGSGFAILLSQPRRRLEWH
jgi:hypothetical protein